MVCLSQFRLQEGNTLKVQILEVLNSKASEFCKMAQSLVSLRYQIVTQDLPPIYLLYPQPTQHLGSSKKGFFFFFMTAPAAYGSSWARGGIGAVAFRNVRSLTH